MTGRARHAVFVDAGYLLAAGGLVTVGSDRRHDAVVAVADLLAWLRHESSLTADGRELLRVYWYDAAPRQNPSPEQQEVKRQPETKLRLGSLKPSGQQKGVDTLLLAEMMDLAATGTVDLMIMVTGDEDLVEAVRRVQAAGIRVYLWGVQTPSSSVSAELREEADRWRLLRAEELRPFFAPAALTPAAVPPPGASPGPPQPPAVRPAWMDIPLTVTAEPAALVTVAESPLHRYADVDRERAADQGRRFAEEFSRTAGRADIEALRGSERPSIPYQVDARLLAISCRNLELQADEQLDYDARQALRSGFWDEVDRLGIIGQGGATDVD